MRHFLVISCAVALSTVISAVPAQRGGGAPATSRTVAAVGRIQPQPGARAPAQGDALKVENWKSGKVEKYVESTTGCFVGL